MRLWVDDGASAREAGQRIAEATHVTPVVGSESLRGDDDVAVLRALPPDRYVLSLDFKDDRFVGPAAVLDEPQHWPHAVIVMTLARVGSGEGPGPAARRRYRRSRRRLPHLRRRGRARPSRYRSAACRRGGGRAHRHGTAFRNDKGRRPRRDHRPLMSCTKGQSRTARRGFYPFQRPESSLPNRCSRPPLIGGASSCCGRFPLQVFAAKG